MFVHHSQIQMDGYRALEEGQTVEFDIGQGRKGEEAQNVRAGLTSSECELKPPSHAPAASSCGFFMSAGS